MASEIKKMKQGMSYSCKEKTIILNVFKYFTSQYPDKCVTELVRRTARATGCSEKSIFQFRKEEASSEGFKVPSKTKIRKNININSRDIKYDESVRQAIRNIVYDLKYKNIVPSLNVILRNIQADNQLPNFSLMTLRRLLFDMGFSYEKLGNKSILIEKPQVKQELVKTRKDKISTLENHQSSAVISEQMKVRPKNFDNNVDIKNSCGNANNLPNTLPKPAPHQVPSHMTNTGNMHLTNVAQPLDYQNHHHPLMTMQVPLQSYSHPIMAPPLITQSSLPHNTSVIMNHQRHPPHFTQNDFRPLSMFHRKEECILGT